MRVSSSVSSQGVLLAMTASFVAILTSRVGHAFTPKLLPSSFPRRSAASSSLVTYHRHNQLHQRPLQSRLSFQSSSYSSSTSSDSRNTISNFVSNTILKMSVKEEIDPGIVEGTNLRIVKYPHPSLRKPNIEITIDQLKDKDSDVAKEITQLVKEMFLLMYAAEGVGLAAPQVGVNQRLMIFNASGDKKKWLTDETVLINPQIVAKSDGTDIDIEGCLSFPDMQGDVERHKWIRVEGYNLKGRKIKKKYVGWEARIFQHEYDHLDGVVYIDHLSETDRNEIQPKLDTLITTFGEGGAL